MERITSISDAKEIMADNFIGPDELSLITDKIDFFVPKIIPFIPFSANELNIKRLDYILVFGLSKMKNRRPITIKTLRSHFGIDDKILEPCFYNQDWYMNEDFVNIGLKNEWFLIRKKIIENTRGINPDGLKRSYGLPSAIQCAFVFFSYYFINCGELLWANDFVWCSDVDSNGDMIYVGRYVDVNGFSKNGFSVHRHLRIRSNYGIIDSL